MAFQHGWRFPSKPVDDSVSFNATGVDGSETVFSSKGTVSTKGGELVPTSFGTPATEPYKDPPSLTVDWKWLGKGNDDYWDGGMFLYAATELPSWASWDGMPVVWSVAATLRCTEGDKYMLQDEAFTFGIDVGDVLANAVLKFKNLFFTENGECANFLFQVVGYLKALSGKLKWNCHANATYGPSRNLAYEGGVKETLTSTRVDTGVRIDDLEHIPNWLFASAEPDFAPRDPARDHDTWTLV